MSAAARSASAPWDRSLPVGHGNDGCGEGHRERSARERLVASRLHHALRARQEFTFACPRRPRPKPTELDVRDVAKRVVSLHAGGDVLVELAATADVPKIMADRDQLTQVLENLVKNAAEATSAAHGGRGGRVRVGVERA